MNAESTPPAERLLSPAAVAARFLTRIDNVQRWIDEGKLKAVRDGRGRTRIPESAVRDFQERAYRRENFPGIHHGLHSWPPDTTEAGNLPAVVEAGVDPGLTAARWPFPHA